MTDDTEKAGMTHSDDLDRYIATLTPEEIREIAVLTAQEALMPTPPPPRCPHPEEAIVRYDDYKAVTITCRLCGQRVEIPRITVWDGDGDTLRNIVGEAFGPDVVRRLDGQRWNVLNGRTRADGGAHGEG